MNTVRRLALVGSAVTIALTLTAAGLRAATPDDGRIRLASLPDGVSAHTVSNRPVFLVRHGAEVTGWLRTSPRGYNLLRWCPADDVFQAPSTGETFDIDGQLMRDHSPRNMDRIDVAVHGTRVEVDPTAVTRGRSTSDPSGLFAARHAAATRWYAAHPQRDLPTDFCFPTVP